MENLSIVISAIAGLISFFSLWLNYDSNKKNTRLSIQEIILKTTLEKAKDCNQIWIEERSNYNPPFVLTISEVIISIEIIEKSIALFKPNYKKIHKENRKDFFDIFWKQLDVNLRILIQSKPVSSNEIYNTQIKTIFENFQFCMN